MASFMETTPNIFFMKMLQNCPVLVSCLVSYLGASLFLAQATNRRDFFFICDLIL